MHRQIGITAMLAGIALVSGCSQEKAASLAPRQVGASSALVEHFSLDTPVDKIAANPNGKAVLTRDMPGLMSSPSYVLFSDMSLSQIASLSGGRLTKTKLNQVEADLAQMPIDARLAQ